MSARRWLVPEVVQTSGMDCGPAALVCLLEGFGVTASYGRLREACQTGVDGTSIDTLEDAARMLGLDAVQTIAPPDHVALAEAKLLPAIVLVRLPSGLLHFVVVWRRHGRFLQVMDPAVGRRWVPVHRFLDEIYVHEMPLTADVISDWVRSDEVTAPLRRRLADVGVGSDDVDRLLQAARDAPGWQGVLDLDAATRTVSRLVDAGALKAGRALGLVVERLATEQPDLIPDFMRFARAGPDGDVDVRGAVLLRVSGPSPEPVDVDELPAELQAALTEKPLRPAAHLASVTAQAAGRAGLIALVVAAVAAAAGVVVEALLFRGVIDAPGTARGRLFALAAVAVALMLVDFGLVRGAQSLGRRLEGSLRGALLQKLPRLPDRHLRSRPVSDVVERAHRVHQLRDLPTLAAEFVRAAAEVAAVTVAIAWVDPGSTVPAVIAALASVGAAVAAQPLLIERDLRLRSHGGALATYFLDGMLGLVALRAHTAERVVEAEHDRLLHEWVATARALARAVVTAEGVQRVVGFGAAVLIVWGVRERAATEPGTFLLVAFWASVLPALGDRLGLLARQWPVRRSITYRLLEPLATPVEQAAPASPVSGGREAGVAIEMDGVTVIAGGHVVLDDIDLTIGPGEHVAVVGSSGAGKSSLAGVLLGWSEPAAGQILVDGAPLDLVALRRVTAWVDPAVRVWNRPLAANLAYGNDAIDEPTVAAAIADAELSGVVDDRPLGEGGGLLSGGEGQRVRLGRARLKAGVRLAVLDEPFRGLGRDQRHRMLQRVLSWWPGATLLFVTHDVAETLEFGRVIVVDGGRVVEDGTPVALAADSSSRYHALLAAERETQALLRDGWRRVTVDAGRVASA